MDKLPVDIGLPLKRSITDANKALNRALDARPRTGALRACFSVRIHYCAAIRLQRHPLAEKCRGRKLRQSKTRLGVQKWRWLVCKRGRW